MLSSITGNGWALIGAALAVILAGCGSANPCTEERYCDTEHLFFEGRMLAILRASDVTGKTVVTVTSEGIEPASVEIEVI